MTWERVIRFASGHEVRERVLPPTKESPPGTLGIIETRIFDTDGKLLPLPNGRCSPADDEKGS